MDHLWKLDQKEKVATLLNWIGMEKYTMYLQTI